MHLGLIPLEEKVERVQLEKFRKHTVEKTAEHLSA